MSNEIAFVHREVSHRNVRLRALDWDDAENVTTSSGRSRAYHRKWGVMAPRTIPEFASVMNSQDSGHCMTLAVIWSDNNALSGLIRVRRSDFSGQSAGLLTYFAFVPWHGHGLMSAALKLLAESAAELFGYRFLVARVDPDNRRSERLLSRVGFRFVQCMPRLLEDVGPRVANVWCLEL